MQWITVCNVLTGNIQQKLQTNKANNPGNCIQTWTWVAVVVVVMIIVLARRKILACQTSIQISESSSLIPNDECHQKNPWRSNRFVPLSSRWPTRYLVAYVVCVFSGSIIKTKKPAKTPCAATTRRKPRRANPRLGPPLPCTPPLAKATAVPCWTCRPTIHQAQRPQVGCWPPMGSVTSYRW